MNPFQKKQAIANAMLEAVKAGNGGWIKGLLPAVKAVGVTKTMNGHTLRAALQTLLDKGLVCRAAFDPAADDEYFVLPGTAGARCEKEIRKSL